MDLLFPTINDIESVVVERGHCHLYLPLYYSIFQVLVNFMLPVVLICAINAILFTIAQKQYKDHSKVVHALNKSCGPVKEQDTNDGKVSAEPRLKTRNLKAAKRTALCVGVCLACWLSYIVIVVSSLVCECISRELIWVANGINYSSTVVTPLLYGLFNKSIRAEVLNELRKRLKYRTLTAFLRAFGSKRMSMGANETPLSI